MANPGLATSPGSLVAPTLLLQEMAAQVPWLALTVDHAVLLKLLKEGSVNLGPDSLQVELLQVWCAPAAAGWGTLLAFEARVRGQVGLIFVAPVLGFAGGVGKALTLVFGECCGPVMPSPEDEAEVGGCRVTRGLWKQHLQLAAVQARVAEAARSGQELLLVGSSQGAALAALAFWRAASGRPGHRLRLLACAMPRVGCVDFWRQLAALGSDRILLARVAGDPVPELPPWRQDWLDNPTLRGRTVLLSEGEDCFARSPCLSVSFVCCSWPRKHPTMISLLPRLLERLQDDEVPDEAVAAAERWEAYWERRKGRKNKKAILHAALASPLLRVGSSQSRRQVVHLSLTPRKAME
mmetsp:Transcript_89718/g.262290  ORF Transcript_89718/g.262290 Transcript_89718/m.262290 type:complete len:352 (+) Transcript_89718:88-1143(+)